MRASRHLGLFALAGIAGLVVAPAADARMTIIDDDPDTLGAMVGVQPGGGAGLGPSDGVYQVATTPPVLPAAWQVARVPAEDLLGRGSGGMTSRLRAAITSSPGRRVLIDALGPGFRGDDGAALARALATLSRERVAKNTTALRSRRVHVSVPDPGALLTDAGWAGARLAIARSGGVWLQTTAASGAWTPAQWLTWPGETAQLLARTGSSASRAHVVFGEGDQASAWTLARTAGACAVLANGPGARRLGASATSFVTRFRRDLPPAVLKTRPTCLSAPALTDAAARTLEQTAAREAAGFELPAGALFTPPLVAGQPAQLDVRLGSDPLGLAAAAGIDPEELWSSGAMALEVRAPGAAVAVGVDGDGAARVQLTPTSPGPVTMSLTISSDAADRMAGAPPGVSAEVAPALRRVGATSLIGRVVAAPGSWRIDVPIAPPGGAPGDPVAVVIAPPA